MRLVERAQLIVNGVQYEVVLHVYGENDWRGFTVKSGKELDLPETGRSKEEVLGKIKLALLKGDSGK